MEALSSNAYIPKSKIRHVKARKEKKPKPDEKMNMSDSDEELSVDNEELKQFDESAKDAKFVNKKFKKQVDTNVVALDLTVLNLNKSLATGDPIKCGSCSAYLSKYSVVAFKDKVAEWNCEFCTYKNTLSIESEELPKEDQVTYVLEKIIPKEESKVISTNDPIIAFCIDISGSMDCTTKSSSSSKYSKSKGVVSRLECVKLAIDKQINELKGVMPNAKVGFVTFEESVVILGDGMNKPFTLHQSSYMNFFQMIELCVSHSDLIDTPISKSIDGLLHQLALIRTGGSTALGPGLTAALAVTSRGGAGSKVILCTDGLANKGIGTVEGGNPEVLKQSAEFYNTLGNYAKEHGVIVSLVSIVESECKLEMISPVATLSGGDIAKVNPLNLESDFKEFLSERVLASNVEARIRIHKALEFRNVLEGKLESNNTVLVKDVGNVTESTKLSFEYKVKDSEEIEKMTDVDLEKLVLLPFQAVIHYKTADNMLCLKIISMVQKTTSEKEEAEKGIKEKVLLQHATGQTVAMAMQGNYDYAMNEAVVWNKYSKKGEVQRETKDLYKALNKQNIISPQIPMASAPRMAAPTATMKMMVGDDLTVNMNTAMRKK
jgi:hypothetical protein